MCQLLNYQATAMYEVDGMKVFVMSSGECVVFRKVETVDGRWVDWCDYLNNRGRGWARSGRMMAHNIAMRRAAEKMMATEQNPSAARCLITD